MESNAIRCVLCHRSNDKFRYNLDMLEAVCVKLKHFVLVNCNSSIENEMASFDIVSTFSLNN